MRLILSATVMMTLSLSLLSGMALAQSKADIESMKQKLVEIMNREATEKANLDNFDDLDFRVYSNQKWDELKKSHAPDILVHYPDGTTTRGIDAHIDKMKPMFVFAPDHKITEHPIRVASGQWTAVMGRMTGTFSKPMPIGDGKAIPPTGNSFTLDMVTIGRWVGTTMAEEWLFFDNANLARQLGLSK